MSMGGIETFQKPIDYIAEALGPYSWSITTVSETAQQYFKLINQSTSRLSLILDELTQLSIVTQGGKKKVRVGLKKELTDLMTSLKHMEGYDQVHFEVTVEVDKALFCDRQLMVSIMQNLITNSIRYRSQDRESYVRVKVYESQPGSYLMIEVEDNGQGIDKEHQDKVFDMFFRGNAESKGTGLGLYIVKNAVEKLKGSIEVTSEVGKGTTFNISSPFLYASA